MVCFFHPFAWWVVIFPRNRAIKPKVAQQKATLRVTSENFLRCVCVACTQIAQERGTNKEKPPKNSGKQERAKIRGQSADHVGAVTVTPRVAMCQITHLARVNNYSETHIIALHYRVTYLTRASPRDAPSVSSCSFTTCDDPTLRQRKASLELETVKIEPTYAIKLISKNEGNKSKH